MRLPALPRPRTNRRAWLVLAAVVMALPATPPALACSPAPLLQCRTAGRNSLEIRHDPTNSGTDRLRWRWRNGQATLQLGFGSPTTATAQTLCVYDDRGLVASLTVPPMGNCGGQACWTARSGKGFTYKDKSATRDGVQTLALAASTGDQAKIQLDGKGVALPAVALPLHGPVTVQLINDTSGVCFTSALATESIRKNDGKRFLAKAQDGSGPSIAPLASPGCGTTITRYGIGPNDDSQTHDGIARTFGVYLPPGYDLSGMTPTPMVMVFHGGFGSGDQVFGNARFQALADAEGIVVVSPDGVLSPGGIRTWNAGGCCGYAASQDVDDVGFVAGLLDSLGQTLCLDLRRIHATGMSNGAMLSYRLACELSARLAAVGPVAGSDMTASCQPTRPVPVMHVHGTADMNVPWEGGQGCGVAGVPYVSVADSVGGWTTRNGAKGSTTTYLDQGDGHCTLQGKTPSGADVVLCAIDDGGHNWPGGLPGANLSGCPITAQSTTFDATRNLYDFFRQHPLR